MNTPERIGPDLVQSPDGRCMVRGCEHMARIFRDTRQGWFSIFYCHGCERKARWFFR